MNEIEQLKEELQRQNKIAYTAGMLQRDVSTRTLLESLSEGIVIINQECRIVLWSVYFPCITERSDLINT